ncbi:hypothetical protein QL285_015036 [Trifolium repens]|jgi:hypothetical protein|nr:hypothetical protein QL285_015036 [Trifolium repens]
MIVPTQTVHISSSPFSSSDSSSSSFEETEYDSSHEPISTLLKKGCNPKPKATTETPIVKEFVSDGNSILDHLVSHISGDAFTTSTLNSPNHPINKFLSHPVQNNVDTEPEVAYNIPSPPPPKSP